MEICGLLEHGQNLKFSKILIHTESDQQQVLEEKTKALPLNIYLIGIFFTYKRTYRHTIKVEIEASGRILIAQSYPGRKYDRYITQITLLNT
jgi:hypothetical protein